MKLSKTFLLLISLFIGQLLAEDRPKIMYNTAGLDMEILSYGGSLGGFWAFHPTPGIIFDAEADWAISEGQSLC